MYLGLLYRNVDMQSFTYYWNYNESRSCIICPTLCIEWLANLYAFIWTTSVVLIWSLVYFSHTHSLTCMQIPLLHQHV